MTEQNLFYVNAAQNATEPFGTSPPFKYILLY